MRSERTGRLAVEVDCLPVPQPAREPLRVAARPPCRCWRARSRTTAGWRSGSSTRRFYRPGERPRTSTRAPDEDRGHRRTRSMTRVLSVAGELGRDGQATAARATNRRADAAVAREDRPPRDGDPAARLRPAACRWPAALSADDTDGFVAKLRYQQTKIEDAPNTILVDRETVAIIAPNNGGPANGSASEGIDAEPKYLFMRPRMNRNGRPPLRRRDLPPAAVAGSSRPTTCATSRGRPVVLTPHAPLPPHPRDSPDQRRRAAARRAALLRTPVSDDDDALRPHPGRDPRARVPALPQDHRRRPPARCSTRATSTTCSSSTSAPTGSSRTATACCRPARVCDRGNACLTCDKFATDRTYLDEHQHQLDLLAELIDTAQAGVHRPHRPSDEHRARLA